MKYKRVFPRTVDNLRQVIENGDAKILCLKNSDGYDIYKIGYIRQFSAAFKRIKFTIKKPGKDAMFVSATEPHQLCAMYLGEL